jgi:serine/threonine-protein kinase
MGLVWKAVRDSDGEIVALKVLRPELAIDETYRKRFLREARIASEVTHKHLVPIVEAGEADGYQYLAVGYVEGRTLAERIEQDGPLSAAETVRLAGEIGAGLDELHASGLVHRDLKPSNVMLHVDGTALLTDFGLAKGPAYTVLTRPGQVMGTLDYLAPELIRGEPAGSASDIYGFGCLVYECIAGQAPFAAVSGFKVGLAHLEDEPPDPCTDRPDVPPSVGWAILQALQKEPARRPSTATAFAHVLGVAARESSQ